MAKIKMARVDFRLIHGQVVTKWIKYYPADMIVIADDVLADDDFMIEIYKMAVPKGVKLEVMKVRELKRTLDKMDAAIFLLFKNIENCTKAVEQGVSIDLLVIGGIPGGTGRQFISDGINLLPEEFEQLEKIHEKIPEIVFKSIPEETSITMEKARKKFK